MGSIAYPQPSSSFSWLQKKKPTTQSFLKPSCGPHPSSSQAKCLERFGSTSVLYFTPPTPSSAPLGYGFLLQPWEATLHSAQAGEQAPFVDAFPSLLALPLFWASPTPYSPGFLDTPMSFFAHSSSSSQSLNVSGPGKLSLVAVLFSPQGSRLQVTASQEWLPLSSTCR